jgi:dTDP-4-dehydrorhamnose 3,5-epimerase-like enzyme
MSKIQKNGPINYYKIYADDTGRRIENLLESNLDIFCLWDNVVNAFTRYSTDVNIMVIYGDMRIITAFEETPELYKFHQYYLSGLDGKIIKIPQNTWMGIQNLNSSKCFYVFNPDGVDFEEVKMSSKIFNWNLKH